MSREALRKQSGVKALEVVEIERAGALEREVVAVS